MDEGNYKFSELSAAYAQFDNPTIEVKVDGKELKLGEDLAAYECRVDLTVDSEENGTLYLKAGTLKEIEASIDQHRLLTYFPLGKELTLHLGYDDKRKLVFTGFIYERNWVFEDFYHSYLEVYCLDYKALMRLNSKIVAFSEVKSYSEVIKKIAGEYNFTLSVDDTKAFDEPATLNQSHLSDFSYISRLAHETGYEFFVLNKELHFRKPRKLKSNLIELDKNSVFYLEYKTSLSGVYSAVEVLAYNRDKREANTFECSSLSDKIGTGKTGPEILTQSKLTQKKRKSLHQNMNLNRNFEDEAKNLLSASSLNLVTLSLKTYGMPEIIPGRFIKLNQFNEELDNVYYIKAVTHLIDVKTYETEIICCSNTIAK